MERQVIDLIATGRTVSIEREVFPRLVGRGLYGHGLSGYWMDIGTPERYLQASWEAERDRPQSVVYHYRSLALGKLDAFLKQDHSRSEQWWTASLLVGLIRGDAVPLAPAMVVVDPLSWSTASAVTSGRAAVSL